MNILGARKFWFGFSSVIILASIIAMFTWGFRPGIDFVGGSILEIQVNNTPSGQNAQTIVAESFTKALNEVPVIQNIGENRYSLRTRTLTNDEKNSVLQNIAATGAQPVELSFESISASVSSDILRKAILGVIVAAIAILFYMAYSFRKVPRPMSSWRFGMAAVVALLHDTILMLGVYAFVSHFYGAEVDSLFITAVLTLLGFSVHDTIVTFDRVRENLLKRRDEPSLEVIMNDSVTETVVRSLTTSFTVLLVLLAMLIFGGETLRYFVLALTVGVVAGSYSSIFIATPLLLLWHQKLWNKTA